MPGDTVDTANGLSGLCGTRTYTVKEGGTTITTWAKIQESTSVSGGMELKIDPQQYSSHIDSAVSATLTIETKYASWASNGGITQSFSVTMNPITCSCDAMAWTAPSFDSTTVDAPASSATEILMTGSAPIIRAPTSDDSAKSSNVAFNRCFLTTNTADRCATTGSYTSANIKYDAGAGITTLPSWITWDQTN